MSYFRALFGIERAQVKEDCILLPFAAKDMLKGLGIRGFQRGKLYGSGSSRDFTAIVSGVGPAFVGDAVLYLKETPCKNVILFGSCGLVKENGSLSLGSLACPSQCYAQESFSGMLEVRQITSKIVYPHKGFLERFLEHARKHPISEVTCATVGSLKLEDEWRDLFIAKGIAVVDMECSAFFAAAGYCGLKAFTLFYISDIIQEKPFYENRGLTEKAASAAAIRKASGLLCEFIRKNASA